MDCSLPGFSVHGIFQARVLQWVAISIFWQKTLVFSSHKRSQSTRAQVSFKTRCTTVDSLTTLVRTLNAMILLTSICVVLLGWRSVAQDKYILTSNHQVPDPEAPFSQAIPWPVHQKPVPAGGTQLSASELGLHSLTPSSCPSSTLAVLTLERRIQYYALIYKWYTSPVFNLYSFPQWWHFRSSSPAQQPLCSFSHMVQISHDAGEATRATLMHASQLSQFLENCSETFPLTWLIYFISSLKMGKLLWFAMTWYFISASERSCFPQWRQVNISYLQFPCVSLSPLWSPYCLAGRTGDTAFIHNF